MDTGTEICPVCGRTVGDHNFSKRGNCPRVAGGSSFFMRRPVQRKYAAKAAHGPPVFASQKNEVDDVAERCNIHLCVVYGVHPVIDCNVPHVMIREKYLDISTRFKIIPPQS